MTDMHSKEGVGIRTLRPVLFFTLADEEVSCKILVALEEIFLLKLEEMDDLAPECLEFESREKVWEYFQEKSISHCRAVGIHTDRYINQCFSPMCRDERNRRHMPKWSPALWGVRVKSNLSEDRIRSAAFQIHADFWRNLPMQLAQNKLPWGSRRTTIPEATKSYQRDWREQRRHLDNFLNMPSW